MSAKHPMRQELVDSGALVPREAVDRAARDVPTLRLDTKGRREAARTIALCVPWVAGEIIRGKRDVPDWLRALLARLLGRGAS